MVSHLKFAGAMGLLSLAVSTTTFAQNQPASPASPEAAVPSFEVATIKPDASVNGGSSGLDSKTGRFAATDVTVRGLLRFEAFMIAGARIVGGPKWMDSARFDIVAKLDESDASHLKSLAPLERNALEETLVQKLLADRFQLKTHWEEREQSVYAIIVAKGGAKLQPAADTKRGSSWGLSLGKLTSRDVTLGQVADLFTQGAQDELGRVVVDHTGIAGAFDINLKWAPNTGASTPDAPSGPSLFTAIQEQLGLKLEPVKAPVKVLVIDHLEMPSEN